MSEESGILLCEGTGFMSRLIQVVSRGPVSHVAILHDGKVLESVPPGGVRVVDLDWWLEDRRDKRIWFRPFAQPMTDEMWNAGFRYASRSLPASATALMDSTQHLAFRPKQRSSWRVFSCLRKSSNGASSSRSMTTTAD